MDWAQPIELADPWLARLLKREEERQHSQICLAAASSLCSYAQREAQSSIFSNIDAEGYPLKRMLQQTHEEIADIDTQVAFYRRYGDRRYARGAEFVNIVEVEAQQRVAAVFATDWANNTDLHVAASDILVNLQCTTGSLANTAVLEALLQPGDCILSMDLSHGGHLSHGSALHISGKTYQVVSYGVDPESERLDYDQIRDLARKYKPALIIGGASSYPWAIEWDKLSQIAHELSPSAYLLADISHPAGLVAGGVIPNPIGYADVVTFTTYKTLCGPRGAVILWTNPELTDKIDRAVFPGLQSSPIFQQIVAMALTFKMARTDEFRQLQHSIAANAQLLAAELKANDIPLAFNGTNTHIVMVNLGRLADAGQTPLRGEWIAQLLERVGIVCNSNLVPGDANLSHATGIRLGTTGITQLGYQPDDIKGIAQAIATLCKGIQPGALQGKQRHTPLTADEERVLWSAREQVQAVLERVQRRGQTADPATASNEPAVSYTAGNEQDDETAEEHKQRTTLRHLHAPGIEIWDISQTINALLVRGRESRAFLQQLVQQDLTDADNAGSYQCASFVYPSTQQTLPVTISQVSEAEAASEQYLLRYQADQAPHLADWLRMLSEGIVSSTNEAGQIIQAGPVVIEGDNCWNNDHCGRMGELLLAGSEIELTALLAKVDGEMHRLNASTAIFTYRGATFYALTHPSRDAEPAIWSIVAPQSEVRELLTALQQYCDQQNQEATPEDATLQRIFSQLQNTKIITSR